MELKRFTNDLRDKYEHSLNQVDAEKQHSLNEIQKMQQQLLDQIEFFKVVYAEMESKKQEVNSTFQACVQYLRREMGHKEEEQKEKVGKHIQEKKSIFRNYLFQ